MKRRIAEETVLFIGIIKWVSLASIIGVIVGFSITLFLKLLNWSILSTSQFHYYFLLLPLAFFLSSWLVLKFAPDAAGHGTEKVIEAVHKNSGKIKTSVIPVKVAATVITLAIGGSAGKEGPSAQIGAGISSLFADIFRFSDEDRMKIVICGISAGFASVFGTPIAGSIFGVEVLFVGSIMYEVLLPSFIAGIMSYEISSHMGINYFYHPVTILPDFNETFFIKVIISGIFFGLCSLMFIEVLKLGKSLSGKIKIWPPLKGLIGGAILASSALFLSTKYLGLGLDTIESSLNGNPADWYSFLIKPILTSLTLNFGGSGGVITPIFFTGAAAGTIFAQLTHLSVSNFAAIGMVALLAGTANTPIAASILSVELFGPIIAPYATVACIISFLMTGHRSVYPSQILSVSKNVSLQVDVGTEMRNGQAHYEPGSDKMTEKVIDVLIQIRSWFKLK